MGVVGWGSRVVGKNNESSQVREQGALSRPPPTTIGNKTCTYILSVFAAQNVSSLQCSYVRMKMCLSLIHI